MYNVTNPKTGKTYTFGANGRERAARLAARLGVEVIGNSGRFRCECGDRTCLGCDDAMDARRDDGLVAHGTGYPLNFW